MITGNVSPNGDLLVPIRMLDEDGHVHRLEAVIDTGFNGHLSLPPNVIQELGLPIRAPVDMVVATDVTFTVDSYRGTILWRGQHLRVPVLAAEGTPLIGTALLWGSLLTAEMIDNDAVAIGPLPAGASG